MPEQPSSSSMPPDRDHRLIESAVRELEAVEPTTGLALHAPPGASLPDCLKEEVAVAPDSIPGYSILDEIHRGGQGVVYQAIHNHTKRKVAIKVMKEGPFASKQDKARFEREVEVLAQLNHPRIVGIHDSGTVAGSFYLVMDYISGQPLDVWMAGESRTIEENLRLFAKICEAVNAAHLQGVIHRDLKPGNIRIDPEGEPHILDFGLAKIAAAGEAPLMTVTGQFVGSLPWASPEQAEGIPGRIDVRTDVYSLGVILYQMLTSRFPYDVVGNMRDVLDRIMSTEPARPSTIRRQINNEVETIVLKCLAKDRGRRYQTAGELARDIGHYLNGEPVEAKRDSYGYVLRKQLRRYRLPVAVGAGFVAMLAVGLVATSVFYLRAEANRLKAEQAAIGEKAAATQAVAAQREAEAAQRCAEAASADARRQAYVANITAADVSFRLHEAAAVRVRLDACPRELRNWEWHHLNAAADTSLVTLRGHTRFLCGVGFALDGRRAVTASEDATAKIWDATTGQELATLRGHTAVVVSAAFSPDGGRIVTASEDATAKIWDATTGQELATLQGHAELLRPAVFSPDGKWVATASYDATARLWDAATGQELATLRGHGDKVQSAAFSLDGRRVVTASDDRTAKLWDATTGQELATLRGHGGAVGFATFSPDGRRVLTTSNDNTAKLWDTATGEVLTTLTGHTNHVWGAAFSPDGKRVATASEDTTAKLWDAATGQDLATFRGHTSGLCFAAFSPDGRRVATASYDGTAKLWDAATGQDLATLRGHTERICFAAFSPDGRWLATASNDKTVKIWDATANPEGATFRGHGGYVLSAVFSPDGRRLVTASWDRTARVWEVATGRELATLRGHCQNVNSAAFSPDGGLVATASQDSTAKLWDAATGRELATLRGHTAGLCSAAFSPDGRLVVTASEDATAKLWDVATLHTPETQSVEASARGPWPPGVSGAAVRELATLRGHTDKVPYAAFSPDGRRVVTASWDRTARLWDAASGDTLTTLTGHTERLWAAAFSPDGRRVVTASEDRSAKLWDAATGQELLTLSGHTHGVTVSLAPFSPDGSRIVTASYDGTAVVWDAATGQKLATLCGHTHFVLRAAFSPDGQRIATASADGTARFWDSVPYAQRYTERQAVLTATEKAQPVVTALHDRLTDWARVAEALRADSALDDRVRQQALNFVLKSSSKEIRVHVAGPSVRNPVNGHFYQAVFVPEGITWDAARQAAGQRRHEAWPGHLATVTSKEENEFIMGNLGSECQSGTCWLGGHQDRNATDYREPTGGWRWITGEPFVFASWAGGEPNDAGGREDALVFGRGTGLWNDGRPAELFFDFMVEYEPPDPGQGLATQPVGAR